MPTPSRPSKPASSAVQNPLETYLRDINATSLLTAEDERRLAMAIGRGDAAARDHMIRANLRLVAALDAANEVVDGQARDGGDDDADRQQRAADRAL